MAYYLQRVMRFKMTLDIFFTEQVCRRLALGAAVSYAAQSAIL